MKTFQFRKEIWLWLIMFLPVLVFLFVDHRLPPRMAIHFDFRGRPNGFMAPGPFMLEMEGIGLGIYLLLLFVPRIDPKKQNYALFAKTFFIFRATILLINAAITCLILMMGVGMIIHIGRITILLISLLFMVLGNYMSNIRPNWFVGIRTPWTLSSEKVWKKTHQLGGRTFFFAGLVGFILSLFLPNHVLLLAFPVLIGVAVLTPIIFSYLSYRKEANSAISENQQP